MALGPPGSSINARIGTDRSWVGAVRFTTLILAVAAAIGAPTSSQWMYLPLVPLAGLMPQSWPWAIISATLALLAVGAVSYSNDVLPSLNGALLGCTMIVLVGGESSPAVPVTQRVILAVILTRLLGGVWLALIAAVVLFGPLALK